MPVRAVLFDLDDTLYDHRGAVTAGLRAAFAAWHRRPPMDRLLATYYEQLERDHLRTLRGEIPAEEARWRRFTAVASAFGLSLSSRQLSRFLARYRSAYRAAAGPTPGAAALLRALRQRGLRVGVVTNHSAVAQGAKLRKIGLNPWVEALVAAREYGQAKPAPGIFRYALARLGAEPSEAVMVGDSWEGDVAGAISAGLSAVWYAPGPTRPAPLPVPVLRRWWPPRSSLPVILGASRGFATRARGAEESP